MWVFFVVFFFTFDWFLCFGGVDFGFFLLFGGLILFLNVRDFFGGSVDFYWFCLKIFILGFFGGGCLGFFNVGRFFVGGFFLVCFSVFVFLMNISIEVSL